MEQEGYHAGHGCREQPSEAFFVAAAWATQVMRSQDEPQNSDIRAHCESISL